MVTIPQAVLAAPIAPGETALPEAKRFTREVLTAWAVMSVSARAERLVEELLADRTGEPVELAWIHCGQSIRLEVREKPKERTPASPAGASEWGEAYGPGVRARWATIDLPEEERAPEAGEERAAEVRHGAGWLGFLADASDLLAGTLDPDMVPAIIAQVVVPRLATWCAVHTAEHAGGPLRLAYVWHADETQLDRLRRRLSDLPEAGADGPELQQIGEWQTLAFPLTARGRRLGVMRLGRRDTFPEEIVQIAEDLSRRAALSMDNARLYARQAAAKLALQRSLLPPELPVIPGLDFHVIYEPAGEDNEVGGDFYDLFPVGDGAWRFAIGDVCGTGPEAAAVTGLARHTLRLLAREGYGVAAVVGRLNQAILEEGERARFLTLLHGEIASGENGVDLTLLSAGHPEPLRLRPDGTVEPVATPQTLLGIFPEADYAAERVHLDPGDVLLAVTDGVTERRSGSRLLDDDGGLARLLADCAGLSARAVAERIRRAVQEFAAEPSTDDVAILALRVP